MTGEKSILRIIRYLRKRINSTGCVYSYDCVIRLAQNWGVVDTTNFFVAIDRLEEEGFLHVLKPPQSMWGQHETYIEAI